MASYWRSNYWSWMRSRDYLVASRIQVHGRSFITTFSTVSSLIFCFFSSFCLNAPSFFLSCIAGCVSIRLRNAAVTSGSLESGFSQNLRVKRLPYFQYGMRCAVTNYSLSLLPMSLSGRSLKWYRMNWSSLLRNFW